ncbi:MAG: aminotransferase class IV [Verrucomicrobia bacterium]|nr:aminotransferase class IV [Verrucomicrobiota bacterium]
MTAPQFWLWNGSKFAPDNRIPVSDRGFRYGMALFESLALRDGGVEFLDAHLARLESACSQCGWPLNPTVLKCAGERLNQMAGPAFARIYVTAGEGGPCDPVTAPQVVLFVEPRSAPSPEPSRVGVHREPFLPLLGGLKTANYWANLAALQAARATGCDEALVFNPRGELISACMANVFVVLEGRLVTPPISSGARAGVVREWVMARRAVIERPISREELSRVSGCFLTSSWTGVKPVAMLDGRLLQTALAEELCAEFFSKR